MPTEIIPPQQWSWFCEGFARQHAGWQTIVEILPPAAQTPDAVAHNVSLRALQYIPQRNEIVLLVDRDGYAPSRHVLSRPRQLTLETDERGGHMALYLDSDAGQRLTVRFPVTLPMEMLDGVSAES